MTESVRLTQIASGKFSFIVGQTALYRASVKPFSPQTVYVWLGIQKMEDGFVAMAATEEPKDKTSFMEEYKKVNGEWIFSRLQEVPDPGWKTDDYILFQ
jgi:hypothetical protein